MHICLFNAWFRSTLETPRALFAEYWHVPCLATALAQLGNNVSVIQGFHLDSDSTRDGVRYITAVQPRTLRALEQLDPDVVHFFGLTLHRPLRLVADWAVASARIVTASYHGGRPHRNPLLRWRQKRALRAVSALFFSAEAHAEAWRNLRVIDSGSQVFICPEVSSPFRGLPRDDARDRLQLDGGPVFAWCGRLHPVKDPLTMLRGFRQIVAAWPDARLLMAFQTEELLSEVENFLALNPAVRERTTLLGRISHAEVEELLSAADFFLQSSVREIGGNALTEAMSCGAIPVVSDIPSFRRLTRDVGPARLFACGDADAMAASVLELAPSNLAPLSQEVRSAFDRKLSYPALAEAYQSAFQTLLAN